MSIDHFCRRPAAVAGEIAVSPSAARLFAASRPDISHCPPPAGGVVPVVVVVVGLVVVVVVVVVRGGLRHTHPVASKATAANAPTASLS
jgi:hypothetical protein